MQDGTSHNQPLDINKLRDEVAESNKRIFLANEKLKRIADKEERLNRYYNDENPNHVTDKNNLIVQKDEIEENLVTYRKELARNEKNLFAAWRMTIDESDPKLYMNQKFDSNIPIIMMPLRIETRFKKIHNDEGVEKDQLWVRAFPDDCSIDTFEEILSETEIENAQDFWADWLIATGQESGRRGAWRTLVDSHGAGRAQYIFENYKPFDHTEILQDGEGAEETSVYLIIKAESGSITESEKMILANYWIRIWSANGNVDLINNANDFLVGETGDERAAELQKNFQPKNLDDDFSHIENRETADVEVKYIIFPAEDDVDKQQQTWAKPPQVKIMPERLYLLGYRGDNLEAEVLGEPIPFPLICGPDPQVKEEDMEDYLDGDLKITREMKWMVDFEEAIAKGMGFVIDDAIDNQVALGYDQLIVAGVRLSANKDKGKELVEELFHNHYNGNSGFSFLPVGTPTNNVLGAESGFSEKEDADESFELMFKSQEDNVDDELQSWWSKSDRHWFTKLLGISPEIFENTINTDGFDQREARAMNISFWPATWGYLLDTMMQPVFTENEIEKIRWYFNHFVVGRGTIPSIRIDDQPYGILPITVFSRMSWFNDKSIIHLNNFEIPEGFPSFLEQINDIILKIQVKWAQMLPKVSHVSKGGDPHQLLLNILGLHGGSVEFHTRLAESLNHLWNLYNSNRESKNAILLFNQFVEYINKAFPGRLLLRYLGYNEEKLPEILDKVFVSDAEELKGHLIDDKPLSEIEPIREYTNAGENYIEWIINAANESLEILRKEENFKDDAPPNALLYLMLRHALITGYWDSSVQLYKNNGLLKDEMLPWVKMEPDFIHIREAKKESTVQNSDALSSKPVDSPFASESRYYFLYQKEANITNNESMTVAEYIPGILQTDPATRYLWDQIKALEHLKNVPTARLERSFIEHIDCVSYRFDAWKWGLVNYQLMALRNRRITSPDRPRDTTDGLYIGAYGWLENVKSENKILTPVDLDEKLADTFKQNDENPITKDSTNSGYIHAPSPNHAVTASLLRSAYLARATKEAAEVFGVNLSSERIRKALSILEGIQNGQNLAALLGYQFERFIHDNNKEQNVDQFIYQLRRQFPLVSNQMTSTQEDDQNVLIEMLEARNVIHGSDLISFVEERLGPNDEPNYLDDLELDNISEPEKQIIVKAVDHIRDTNDAVADLGLAESVHHIVQGNIDRAAGTLDTYSKGNYPQMPDVIQTPRSGVNVTHRVGWHIEANLSPMGNTPKAKAEPGINRLLSEILPGLENIICTVSFYHVGSETEINNYEINMTYLGFDLGFEPIDLLYMINDDVEQAMTHLDDLIIHWVRSGYPHGAGPNPPRPDADITIKYYVKEAGGSDKVSVFELIPLIKNLRSIVLRSRPLRPSDISLPNESSESLDENVTLDINRITSIVNYINGQYGYNSDADTESGNLVDYINGLDNDLKEGTGISDDDIIGNIDTYIDRFIPILHSLSFTGMPHTGIGFAYEWRKQQFKNLYKKFEELLERWYDKGIQYDVLISKSSDFSLTDGEKIEILLKAERKISTNPTLNPGADPAAFLDVLTVKKTAFDEKKEDFDDFLKVNHSEISEALSSAEGLLPYDEFDLIPMDFYDINKACLVFAQDLLTKAKLLKEELKRRIINYQKLAVKYDEEIIPSQKVQLIQEMAKLLLIEDFKMIPSFDLTHEKKEEWGKALSNIEELLTYQKETLKNPLPVDDWFYGVARVREKMGHLEQVVCCAEGFKDQSIELLPVQLPYLEPYCWFALEFGDEDNERKKALNDIFQENDHLLYTAYYQKEFTATEQQCGLLIDEWTEIIPTEEETTGIAFHYDRPNSEPPQTMLLVTSPQLRENWKWNDLIDAIRETFYEAKLRAIEPDLFDETGFESFLPATISTVTKYPINIMMNYASVNPTMTTIMKEDHE